MSYMMVERIWSVHEDHLTPREGNLEIDPGFSAINDSDLLGPLYVESGLEPSLEPSDIIVFLNHTAMVETPDDEVSSGYFVTRCEKDGSGILVNGDLFERKPRDWVTEPLIMVLRKLYHDGYGMDEFGLPNLAKFVAQHTDE